MNERKIKASNALEIMKMLGFIANNKDLGFVNDKDLGKAEELIKSISKEDSVSSTLFFNTLCNLQQIAKDNLPEDNQLLFSD